MFVFTITRRDATLMLEPTDAALRGVAHLIPYWVVGPGLHAPDLDRNDSLNAPPRQPSAAGVSWKICAGRCIRVLPGVDCRGGIRKGKLGLSPAGGYDRDIWPRLTARRPAASDRSVVLRDRTTRRAAGAPPRKANPTRDRYQGRFRLHVCLLRDRRGHSLRLRVTGSQHRDSPQGI